ncbi:hypothetical protein M0R72_18360 [Candidatus Pacearchaeota archaeon]|jgi:hypothetical protein|nr:hypothetical protein [Candidatus Pacearchaeota archaeon]
MLENNDKPNGIYAFSLPDGLPARFTCCICGGPAISEIEIYDEIVCDCCYSKTDHIREEADNQHCCDKMCSHLTDFTFECNGQCTRCIV